MLERALHVARRVVLFDQAEIDLAGFDVGAHHLDAHAVAQAITLAGALAEHHVLGLVVVEVVLAEFGDVNQAFDEDVVDRDEHAEAGHRADGAVVFVADAVLHEIGLQPGVDIAGGVVGAALGHRAVGADFHQALGGQFLALQHGLDAAMHQQVGITADRRGEVGVGLVGQAEVPLVVGAVDRLPERTQHHGLQQAVIGTRLDLLQQRCVILGVRLVAAAEVEAEFGEEAAQRGEFLRRRAFVHAVQRRLLVLVQVIRRADVGRQHAFLDDAVGVVADHRHDVLDLALVVELDLRFGRTEIDRAALGARFQQGAEQFVQRLQVRHQRGLFLVRLGCAGEPVPHLVVGEARMRKDHRRVEAVFLDRCRCC